MALGSMATHSWGVPLVSALLTGLWLHFSAFIYPANIIVSTGEKVAGSIKDDISNKWENGHCMPPDVTLRKTQHHLCSDLAENA